MYKLISLDLDGTLFNCHEEVSQFNIDIINECHKHDIHTIVATGRPPRFTFERIPDLLNSDYIICYNGAMIFYNGTLVYSQSIQSSCVKEILSFLEENKGNVALEVNDVIYSNFDLTRFWSGLSFHDLKDLDDYTGCLKILCQNGEHIPYDELLEKFSDKVNILTTDGGRLIEIMDKSVNKLSAIKWVADQLNVYTEEIIAFGDDLNDCEIIEGVGLGVAMENGHEYLKSISNMIAPSNDEDGVGVVLKKILEEYYG